MPPIGQMRQTVFPDTNMTLHQSAINEQFSQIGKVPFMQGRSVTQSLTSGANTVEHKLGKTASGYFVTSLSANTAIWNDTFSGTTSITLNCSADCSVTIWVW